MEQSEGWAILIRIGYSIPRDDGLTPSQLLLPQAFGFTPRTRTLIVWVSAEAIVAPGGIGSAWDQRAGEAAPCSRVEVVAKSRLR